MTDHDDNVNRIFEKLERIEYILIGEHGDNGICGRIGILEVERKSTQAELTEHKSNHWQIAGLTVTISGIISGVIMWVVEAVKRKP